MRYLLALFFCFSFSCVVAQDTILTKFSLSRKANPTSNLFVHFDKNVYTNNESVYFTAYVLKTGATLLQNHKILAVNLIRDVDSVVILQQKFEMINGISFGGFDLPDSIQTGDYHFLAFTDQLVKGLPELNFIQSITLKTNIEPAFKANIKLLPSENPTAYQVQVSVTSNDHRFLPKPVSIQYQYGNQTKIGTTDASGQLILTLPVQYQLIDPNIYVKIRNGKDSSFISMALPKRKGYASVKFYPEGGNAVIGLKNAIGLEVRDQQNMPIATTALLYKNNQIIDTIATSDYGMGKFMLTYEKNASYQLKLIHDGIVDSTYGLPKAIDNGLALSIPQAVVKDSLNFKLTANHPKKIIIRIHNFQDIFFSNRFTMVTKDVDVTIPLKDVPKGLATLTITDTLNRPLIERIFFAHYDATEKLLLQTDSNVYRQRENVTLKLKINSPSKEGFVSVAVVQESRIDVKKMTDIEGHYYLQSLLEALPRHYTGLPIKDKQYLEQVLLIKGWRRYNWEKLQQLSPLDTILKIDSLKFTAAVTFGRRLLTKPIGVSVLGDNYVRMTNTSANGTFDLNIPQFVTIPDKRMFLFVSDNTKAIYNISLHDDFIETTKKVSRLLTPESIILPSTIPNNSTFLLQGNEKAIRLKEVEIKSKKSNGEELQYAGRGLPGSNTCGDYVCLYNILNCKNHKNDINNTQPIEGALYVGSSMPYHCTNYQMKDQKIFTLFNGIHGEKEFYNNDYKDPLEPAFFSTLYWNYAVGLDPQKETILNFHTSDIMGKFKIVVQGILDKDVIYAEKTFEVRAK